MERGTAVLASSTTLTLSVVIAVMTGSVMAALATGVSITVGLVAVLTILPRSR